MNLGFGQHGVDLIIDVPTERAEKHFSLRAKIPRSQIHFDASPSQLCQPSSEEMRRMGPIFEKKKLAGISPPRP